MRNQDFHGDNEVKIMKSAIWWGLGVLLIIAGVAWFLTRSSETIDNAIINYEEFQTIYTTCDQINQKLVNLRAIPDDDKAFEQFSKAQQVTALKASLTKWVNDYNAKSKMWNRSMWKSSTLPHQLDVNSYPGYYDSRVGY